jgi:hypothetical protein
MTRKSPAEAIAALTEEFRKADASDLGRIFTAFSRFIPEHSSRIAPVVIPRIVGILAASGAPPQTVSQSIDFLQEMLSRASTDISAFFWENGGFLKALFSHIGLNAKLEFDHRIFTIILDFIREHPDRVFDFIRGSPGSILPLLEGCTKASDCDACSLALQLVTTQADVQASLIDTIKPLLRLFRPQLLVGLIVASDELRATITDSELHGYLVGQKQFSLPDVREVGRHFPGVWNELLSLKMLLMTTPPDRPEFVDWIHTMEPQTLELSPELTNMCTDSILSAKIEPRNIDDSNVTVKGLYLFPRLYVLSFADPANISDAMTDRLYALIADRDPYPAAGAIQVIAYWIAKRRFVPAAWTVYQIASLVDGADPSLAQLFRLVLHLYANSTPIAEAILLTDPSIRLTSTQSNVADSPWSFPHLTQIFSDVPSFDGYDEKTALEALADISDYFGLRTS